MFTFLSSDLSFFPPCHFFKFKNVHWRDELQTEPMLLLENMLKVQALEDNRVKKIFSDLMISI